MASGMWVSTASHFVCYSLSNFEITCDVTCGRLHISGELPLNSRVVYRIAQNTHVVLSLIWNTQSTACDITSNLGSWTESTWLNARLRYTFDECLMKLLEVELILCMMLAPTNRPSKRRSYQQPIRVQCVEHSEIHDASRLSKVYKNLCPTFENRCNVEKHLQMHVINWP